MSVLYIVSAAALAVSTASGAAAASAAQHLPSSTLTPTATAAQHLPAPSLTPAAMDLFHRDWVLMNWALKYYDSDRDIALSSTEGAAAAEAFRQLADTNHDGRVTPDEYRAAREALLSR